MTREMNFIMTTFSQTIGSETKASPINALSIQSLPAAKGLGSSYMTNINRIKR